MHKITTLIASVAIFSLAIQAHFAQAQCNAMGWATYDGQSASSITGGGNVTPVKVTTFDQLLKEAASSSPKVIYVMNDMGNGYKGESGDRVILASNKTIIGFKPGITVKAGWLIKGVNNVIIKNLICRGPGNSNSQQNWDCVNIENSKKVWFDHCQIMEGEDGNFDIVKGADNVTATWCKFTYVSNGGHNLSNLIGSSDNETVSHGKLNVTYAYCWWDNVQDRTPRSRYGKIHLLNCYYTKSAGPNAGFMANQRTEACHFDGTEGIRTISTGGKVVHAAIGCLGQADKTIAEGGYTVFTPPYTYKKYAASEVKGLVTNTSCGAGPTLDSPTDCGCDAITGIEEEVAQEQVSIFPNPSKSNFQVNLATPSDIQVMDMEGKIQGEYKNVSNVELGESLRPGIYFLKINSKVYKLIKE